MRKSRFLISRIGLKSWQEDFLVAVEFYFAQPVTGWNFFERERLRQFSERKALGGDWLDLQMKSQSRIKGALKCITNAYAVEEHVNLQRLLIPFHRLW